MLSVVGSLIAPVWPPNPVGAVRMGDVAIELPTRESRHAPRLHGTRWLRSRSLCSRAIFGIAYYSSAFAESALAQGVLPTAHYLVGMTQLEFVDPADGGRPLNLMLIHPAAPAITAVPFKIFMGTNLHRNNDTPVVYDGLKRPLIVFSHGAGMARSMFFWGILSLSRLSRCNGSSLSSEYS